MDITTSPWRRCRVFLLSTPTSCFDKAPVRYLRNEIEISGRVGYFDTGGNKVFSFAGTPYEQAAVEAFGPLENPYDSMDRVAVR